MKIIREFAPADRYTYDFGVCSYKNGFAQLDTGQDASYFGTWVSPSRRMVVCYCEGDVTTKIADTDAELLEELRAINAWNVENGHGPARIDPGLDPAFAEAFEAIGAAEFMSGSSQQLRDLAEQIRARPDSSAPVTVSP